MKRIGIVGAGGFGWDLAHFLASSGAEVLLLDRNQDIVQRISATIGTALQGDGTDKSVLSKAGFQNCDAAVVAIGEAMESSILATMNLKEIGVKFVVARAVSDMHGRVLQRVGADQVVYPNKERAQRLARSLRAGSAVDYFSISEGVSVVEMKAPSVFAGKSLAETDMRRKHGVTVLAIKRNVDGGDPSDLQTIASPSGDDVVRADDILLLFGSDDSFRALS